MEVSDAKRLRASAHRARPRNPLNRCRGLALIFHGHALMESRNGLIVDPDTTRTDGHAGREAALITVDRSFPGDHKISLGADKGYDTADFAADLRTMNVAPHVDAKIKGSAIDGRTTRRACYEVSK